MLRERLALPALARRAQVALPQLAQAAADDDDLRVEDVDEVGEAGAQVAPGPLDRRRSGRVAGVRRLLQQSRVPRGALLAGQPRPPARPLPRGAPAPPPLPG